MPNQPATPAIVFRAPDELRDALQRIADDRGETLSAVVRRACSEYVRRYPLDES
ncbi:ribbon-helix-helix protein, CopG family [Nocardioides aquiterrae]|uniref:Ribbon-helix-helix protein, CopG family n=1 Tax=Nocardioides aquiterrae TaxID=203799 RepID=A0ABN1UD52_9ACTN